jgi:hypothetical protein
VFALQDWTDFDDVATAKMRTIVETRCRDDRWSDESHACFRAMRRPQDHARCDRLLTLAQKEAIDRDLKKSVPSSGEPPPDDSVATTLCPTSGSIVVKTWRSGTSGPDPCAPSQKAVAAFSPAAAGYELRVLLTALVATETAVSCKVTISVRSQSDLLGWLSGGARVPATGTSAETECVDALVEDLITKKVGPLVQRHAAKNP